MPGAKVDAKAHLGPAEATRCAEGGHCGTSRGTRYLHTACACFPWFLSFGSRTQNSRLAGERPEIWSPPRAGLTVVCIHVCVNVCVCVVRRRRAPCANGTNGACQKKTVFFLEAAANKWFSDHLFEGPFPLVCKNLFRRCVSSLFRRCVSSRHSLPVIFRVGAKWVKL